MKAKINRVFVYLDKLGKEVYSIEIQYDMDFYDFEITKEQAIKLSELLDLDIQNY